MKVFKKKNKLFYLTAIIVLLNIQSIIPDNHVQRVNIYSSHPDAKEIWFNMGSAVSPIGSSIKISSRSVYIDDKPSLPVMGEFHFSRYPDSDWRTELLKMKAGGINIVATYIFWIHHEELEGQFNWTGQRDLRKFIQTCQEVGLPLILRLGPWSHGECRNGGLPEWLVTSGIKLRQNNTEYLSKVQTWFTKIYDFQAPLGEFGQINPHYHLLRRLHLFLDKNNQLINIILSDEDTSLNLWKDVVTGKERLLISNTDITCFKNNLDLTSDAKDKFYVLMYPESESVSCNEKEIRGKKNGIFTEYWHRNPSPTKVNIKLTKINDASLPLRNIKNGKAGVAEQPSEEDFDKAATWKITLPKGLDTNRDIYLNIKYIGDIARIYSNDQLLTDNFYNGKDFYIGLKRFAPTIYNGELLLKILPFQKDADIYLPVRNEIEEPGKDIIADVISMEVKEKTSVRLNIK